MAGPGLAAPPGTFSPGTKIQVGGHRVVIQKYLSEGGFAHVYLVKMAKPVDGTDLAVLKRVAVPDKDALRNMRTEVETMKRLKGHRPIVTYIDSHASELRGGGYEVFLLMEYCNGGGLIDFMNTRLQHRLTEPEILTIFADIAEGVACMHYLKPPLLHRDLKVENVLITSRASAKRFKLCDFGSAAAPRPAPTTVVECRLMDEDVQKHTTLQYRSPEMIDVYRKQPLNEKSDIWALGVLLYKLCYYTTPFEDQGQLAILNASYRYPSYPVFSDRIKKLIASMLRESIDARPTIYHVLKEACAMQGREVPIKNIYAARSPTDSRTHDKASGGDAKTRPQVVGAVFSAPVQEQQRIPDVVPMRRGRPAKSSELSESPPKKVTEGDPFAALDGRNGKGLDADELSSRFPTLDQFTLLHDQGAKFDFDSSAASPPAEAPAADLGQRVAERLADDAFVSPESAPADPLPSPGPHSASIVGADRVVSPVLARPASAAAGARPRTDLSKAQTIISSNPDLKAIASHANSKYVSIGTMTSDMPSESPTRQADQGPGPRHHPGNLALSAVQSHSSHARQSSLSSQRSLEDGRPLASPPESAGRAEMPAIRPRPASTTFESSTLEFLRERESWKAQSRSGRPLSRGSQPRSSSSLNAATRADDSTQPFKVGDLLLDADGSDSDAAERPRSSKRTSVSLPTGTISKLAGKFGDAFKRFEGSTTPEAAAGGLHRPPSKGAGQHELTPIAGSEATDGRSDDGLVEVDPDKATPEMRREIERRQLQEEEERVAAAQAEYRRRVASDGASSSSSSSRPVPGPKKVGGVSRAAAIQSRVQSLLDEEQRPSQVQRTAEGYGKYSDAATAASRDKALPSIPRKPSAALSKAKANHAKAEPSPSPAETPTASRPAATGSRPVAPRKPVHLNSLPTGGRPPSPAKRSEHLMAAELPGRPVLEMSAQERDDYVREFAKRFPSLNSMELQAAMSREGGATER
ncbi:hypothetical protein CDD83_8201 [Cordyceps sp. RAO-2017]|nr:hypothetical protein CDD83_8201 [Cordyceps sp. RAO-2017]